MGDISLASEATHTLMPGVAPFLTWNTAFAQSFHPVTASLPQSQRINALHTEEEKKLNEKVMRVSERGRGEEVEEKIKMTEQ